MINWILLFDVWFCIEFVEYEVKLIIYMYSEVWMIINDFYLDVKFG